MNIPIKPFPIRKVITYGFAIIVGTSLLSLFFLFLQVRTGVDRRAGEVIQITAETITIVNAAGEKTTLLIRDDVTLKGVDALSEISVGQRIMSGGTVDSEGHLKVKGLRVFGE